MKEKYKNYINYDHHFDKITMFGILCLLIVLTGIFGFIYEFIFYFLNSGMTEFYYRGGNFLPWINIYAIGSIFIYFLTYRHRKNPIKVFLISLVICGLLEYIAGYGVYTFNDGARYWDYNTEIWNFGNINGFICLRSVTFFGLSALLLIYGLVPLCFFLANSIPKKTFLLISISLFSVVLFDELYNLIFARLLDLPRASDIYKQLGLKYMEFK